MTTHAGALHPERTSTSPLRIRLGASPCAVEATIENGALTALRLLDRENHVRTAPNADAIEPVDRAAAEALRAWLDAYTRGEDPDVRVPMRMEGTPFRLDVWRAIARVRRGRVISYTALAEAAGRPNAVRAAASACGDNPIPLLIPCHRIVGAHGHLGGFSGGLHRKRALLAAEGWTLSGDLLRR